MKKAIDENTAAKTATMVNGIRKAVESPRPAGEETATPARAATKAAAVILIQAALLNQLETNMFEALKWDTSSTTNVATPMTAADIKPARNAGLEALILGEAWKSLAIAT